jgi:hypothetical protein
MEKKYDPNKKWNNISVFKALPTETPNAPQFNVIIEMADGVNYRGGLWTTVSKGGLTYLRGSLEVDTGQYTKGGSQTQQAPRAQAPAPSRQEDTIDW